MNCTQRQRVQVQGGARTKQTGYRHGRGFRALGRSDESLTVLVFRGVYIDPEVPI